MALSIDSAQPDGKKWLGVVNAALVFDLPAGVTTTVLVRVGA
jgi:hypothetical protein